MSYSYLKFNQDAVFLVTGGAGFIGSNLCEALLNMGYRVHCLDNLSTGKKAYVDLFINHPNYTFIKGDIRDYGTCYKATKKIDYVLHNAAWGSVPRSIALPLIYEEINIRGTLNMMQASCENKVKKFVYASSSSVYGDEPSLLKTEGKEGKLLSPYALTKRTCEEYGRLYADLYGLDTYGLRYFHVFGKRQDPKGTYAAVIPKFIKQLLNNEQPVIYGNGMQSRDFTYIENIIEANLKACLAPHDAAGQSYNTAYGECEHLLDVYKILVSALGKEIKPIFAPNRKGDIKHSSADITKAKKMLGYEPKYNFDEGIKLTIHWYKENLFNFI